MMLLRRRDPVRRMARYYRLGVQWTLGLAGSIQEIDLIREWGRIGSAGTVRADPHPDLETAARAAAGIEALKRRKGYR